MLEGADGGFALHGGKILKELVQSLPPFEVIQQGLERNSSPAKHRGSPNFMHGLLIYVVMTAGAVLRSTGFLRRRMAAEMRVMISPTGRGSMKV
jgi:hypothetical protein